MLKYRANKIFKNAHSVVVVIESIDVSHKHSNRFYLLYGALEPIAVLIFERGICFAFDMKAQPVGFEQLRMEIPNFDSMISLFSPD